MKRHARFLQAFLSLSAGLCLGVLPIGCTTPSGGRPPGLQPLPSSMTLVISQIDTEYEDTRGDAAWGFDLDGRTSQAASGRCDDEVDRPSIDGAPGVDDQFAEVGPALFDATYADHEGSSFQHAVSAAISHGQWLRTLTVSGIDDAWDDPDVMVTVARATSGSTLAVTADGALAPGATLTGGASIATVHGALTHGVLGFSLDDLSITLGDLYPDAMLTGVRVEGRLTPDGLSHAMVGGAISVDQVVALASSTGGASLTRMDVEVVMHPDLEPDATGAHCAAVSVGVGIGAVPATLISP